jgi:hypothetical protein
MNFQNVFVIGSGRCGSSTFAKACSHISNWTTAHESHNKLYGYQRFDYPAKHIEVDTLLCWRLGELLSRFPDALYVHLMRDPIAVANSWAGRRRGVLKFWWRCIIGRWTIMNVPDDEVMPVAIDMVQAVTANIRFALKDAQHVTIWIENPRSAFEQFWNMIDGNGDFNAAVAELNVPRNVSSHSRASREI